MSNEIARNDDTGANGSVGGMLREIGFGLLGGSFVYVAVFTSWTILDSNVGLFELLGLIPAYFLFILTPLIGFFDFPWAWIFPWLVPTALACVLVLAFRLLPTNWLRYPVAILFSFWWAYGFCIHFHIYAGV